MYVWDGAKPVLWNGQVSFSGTISIGTVTVAGSPNLATGQITINTTATVISTTRTTRRSITVVNHGTTSIFLGGSTVSTTTGVLLIGVAGAAVTFNVTGTISGIVTSGSQQVSFEEEYA
jgi:hypothetical protein